MLVPWKEMVDVIAFGLWSVLFMAEVVKILLEEPLDRSTHFQNTCLLQPLLAVRIIPTHYRVKCLDQAHAGFPPDT